MALRRTLVALPQLLALLLIFAPSARARTIDRVAAIAGEHVILVSEVRRQAAPQLAMVHETDPLARARAQSKIMHDTCERMIDDALVADEAERKRLSTSRDEIDRAIVMVGQANGLSPQGVIEAAQKQGFDESSYRQMLGLEILRAKLVQLRTHDAKKLDDAEKIMIAELRSGVYVEDRIAP